MSKSSITTKSTPGQILRSEFLDEMGISARKLATDINVPANRITEIIRGRRGITADTALRLARYFGTSPQLWLNLQTNYDLYIARRDHGGEIKKIRSAA
jgi:addiction module HigA family antidote